MTESSPCASDLRSYEIDYDEVSECTESLLDTSHNKIGMTAKGNEISFAKMPLMRIRSVEIVFEDEMSTCTDTGILDRSIELIVSDSSDDSTKCVDDLEHLHIDKDANYDSVTLNADGDLSDDSSDSLAKDIVEDFPKMITPQIICSDFDIASHVICESTLAIDVTLSPNVSEIGDSGRFTEEACSSHFESVPIEDALLSNSFDAINVDKTPTLMSSFELSDACSVAAESTARLYEYIDSNSDSSDDSDNTATCDADTPLQHLTSIGNVVSPDDNSLGDSYDLQYDSFIDMGKF